MNKITTESATQLNKILSFLPKDKKISILEDIWNLIHSKVDESCNTNINTIDDIEEKIFYLKLGNIYNIFS